MIHATPVTRPVPFRFALRWLTCLVFALCGLSASTLASAATCVINSSNTWTGLTAACGFTPGAADTITVKRGATLTVNTTATCGSLELGDDTGATGQRGNGTLLFNASTQLTCASIVLGDNSSGGSRTGTITMANGATLITSGIAVNVFGGWTPSTGTVQFQATNTLPAQFNANGYNNLTISAGTTTLSGTVTVGGALNVASSSVLAVGNNALTVGGNFTVNGTVSGTGAISLTGAAIIDGTGSVTNTGSLTLSTAAKTIAATANLSFSGPVNVNIGTANNGAIAVAGTIALGAATFTNSGSVTSTAIGGITGAVGSVWTNAAGSTLRIGGPLLSTGTLNANASGNTVEYTGTQTLKTPAGGYFHLALSTGGAKTPSAGTLTILGNLTVASGVTYAGTSNNPTVNLAGDFSNSGTFNSGTGVFSFNGSAPQTLTGATTFTSLRMANTGASPQLTINSSVTVSGSLTLAGGNVMTGNNTVVMSAGATVSRTTGHIVGNLRKNVATGATSRTFEIGDVNAYGPVTVSFGSVTVAGNLTATSVSGGAVTSGDHPDLASSAIAPTESVNRYWVLTNSGVTFNTYSITVNYASGSPVDLDSGVTAANLTIGKADGCDASLLNCTWTYPTLVGTPTATSAQASGLTSFSGFAVGQRRVTSFQITVPASPFSTCNAAPITITALDTNNNPVMNYTGTINITTLTADGDWSLTTGGGTLTNSGSADSGVADDGKATYAFVNTDNGVVTLSLANIQINSDVTITVVDNVTPSSSTTSAAIQYRGNQFAISNDPVQVAGRPQSMKITRTRGAACSTAVPGNANLKAWYTTAVDHPAGATAPAITGASPAITTSVPASNNFSVTFDGNGEAAFTLTTTDVGKYAINIRDDGGGVVDGTSAIITTSPFALVANGISKGAITNPSGTATTGTPASKFVAAGDTFQATVTAHLWSAAADADDNGLPDAGATVAQIIASGATPRFAWPVTLAAATPITPATVCPTCTLSNGSIASAAFSGGIATPTNLSYAEVGSFTLTVSAASYLNTGAAFVAGSNGIAVDAGGGRTGIVGRIYPHHFTVTTSSITPACAGGGGFTYMAQNLGYGFTIEARNLANAKTNQYDAAGYSVGTVAIQAENNDNGVDLSPRLTPAPSGTWSAGSYAFTTTTATFNRAASPDGPFDALRIGASVSDTDGPVLDARDMNPGTTGACGGGCTGQSIGAGTTKVRFGRLREQNALASSGAIVLPVPVALQYWDGTMFRTNTDDTACTSIPAASVALTPLSGGGSTSVVNDPITFASGTGTIRLAAPGAGSRGFVLVTTTVPSYLQGTWTTGGNWNENPTARASWGVFGSQPQNFIYQRENY